MAGVTVDLPDAIVLVLSQRARAAGMTLGEYLRHVLERSAREPDVDAAAAAGGTAGREELLAALQGASEAVIDRDAVADELRNTLRMLQVQRPARDEVDV